MVSPLVILMDKIVRRRVPLSVVSENA